MNKSKNNNNFHQTKKKLMLLFNPNPNPIYNPKNLPLGWDGKPIPYWLYKLHGLGI